MLVDRVVPGNKIQTRLNFPLAMARHLLFAPLCVFSFGKWDTADVENERAVANRFEKNMVKDESRVSLTLSNCHDRPSGRRRSRMGSLVNRFYPS